MKFLKIPLKTNIFFIAAALSIVGFFAFLTYAYTLDVIQTNPPSSVSEGAPSALEQTTFNQVNAERTSRGLQRLRYSSRLYNCAKPWSREMARRGDISHNGNLSRCAGDWTVLGENVGMGSNATERIVDAWMGSCGHRANILLNEYSHHAVGIAEANGTYFYTDDFARYGNQAVGPRVDLFCDNFKSFPSSVRSPDNVDSSGELRTWYRYPNPVSNCASRCRVARRATVTGGESVLLVQDDDNGATTAATYMIGLGNAGGRKYRVDMRYNARRGSAPEQFYVDFLNSNFGRIFRLKVDAPLVYDEDGDGDLDNIRKQWVKLSSGVMRAPSGTRYMRFIISSSRADTGLYWWDDTTIERVIHGSTSEPTVDPVESVVFEGIRLIDPILAPIREDEF